MAAGRLETVDVLQSPAETEIPNKDVQDHISRIFGIEPEEPHERKAEKKHGERCLVSSAVVHA
jgi:hypothetical protein